MAGTQRLDPADVAAAVRDLLRKETDRVDDPHPIPEDRSGWHALNPIADDTAGIPLYDPESWRWFDLVDVGFVDELVLIVFRWTDPDTPELRYGYLAHADRLPGPDSVATVVRAQLRTLLRPGRRDRVDRQWLSTTTVLIRRGPADTDQEHSARRVESHEEMWRRPRTAAST